MLHRNVHRHSFLCRRRGSILLLLSLGPTPVSLLSLSLLKNRLYLPILDYRLVVCIRQVQGSVTIG